MATEEKRSIVRTQARKALWSIVIVIAISAFIGIYFETHLQQLATILLERSNPWIIAFVVFLNDAVISPFPPDLILVLLAKAKNYPNVEFFVILLGLASACSGTAAWLLARRFLRPQRFGAAFQRYLAEHGPQIETYGKWMVALGALTPLPYSMTCWAAGFLKMRFRPFFAMTLLRIPRFYLYFEIFRAFGDLRPIA